MKRTARHMVCLLIGVATQGCYGDFENFVGRASRLECKRLEVCDAPNYAQYEEDCAGISCNRDTRRRCRDDVEDRWRALDRTDDCEYDPDEAKLCIDALREARKECPGSGNIVPPDDCAFVFDCSRTAP